jgi:branched-chain amino acid transport system ATP-binding protein
VTAGALLEVRDLSKSFGGVAVTCDVSFDVVAGSRVAMIGPNGAGKTTMFNLISGVERPDKGTITFDGQDIVDVPSRQRIARGLARSFQNIRLMPHLSVVENVMLGQHARAGRTLGSLLSPMSLSRRSTWRQEAEHKLEALGVTSFDAQVDSLPYGVRKKIEVVRALMADPKLLLLDEPAAGLNPTETAALRDFLRSVSDQGVTLFVVEHDMSFVRQLCPQSIVLNFGRKIYDGPTDKVHEDAAVVEAYLGRPRGQAAGSMADHAA